MNRDFNDLEKDIEWYYMLIEREAVLEELLETEREGL